MSKELSVKSYLDNPLVQDRVNKLLKDRSPQFLTSIMATVNSNPALAECNPASVLNAAMTAASMDLPVNQNLGFAYIIPYNDKKLGKVAQFQMGYKGFIQLAMRTGQYRTMAATEIYEGQLISQDPLRGNVFDFTKKDSDIVIGYASLLVMTTGFEKDLYLTVDQIQAHAKRYSQSYKNKYGNWVDDFDGMAKKTVLKLLLSKFGMLSTELQKAIEVDQSVLNGDDFVYVDNRLQEPTAQEKEEIRVKEYIEASDTVVNLKDGCEGYIQELDKDHELRKLYENKLAELEAVDGE